MSDALRSVSIAMRPPGIPGTEVNLNVQACAENDPKGSAAAIESTLYSLLVARDWFDCVATKGLTIVWPRVGIVTGVSPGASLAEPFGSEASSGV